MSNDEDDERMDRARRIRRMREGRRDDDATEQPAENGGVSSDVDTDAEAAANGDGNTGDEPVVTADDTTQQSGSEESAGDSETEDGWFEDSETNDSATGPQSTTETEGDAEESADTSAGGDAVETASSAAAAAAAFEVEEAELAESPSQADADETVPEDDDTADGTTDPEVAATETEPQQEKEIRVLEFRLGDERYCLDIMHVEEIVKKENVTRVPNTPPHVHGVVDLRGQITTILDPKVELDIEGGSDEQLLIVFDGETFEDQGHAGWLVDEVRQVLPVTESEIKESPIDRTEIKGVIERDDEFIIWTEPQIALGDEES